MITIRPLTDKKSWEEFLIKYASYYPLFQSWNWGEVQSMLGFSVTRLGIYEKEVLVGVCCVILIKARRGTYVHLRHGPVFVSYKNEYFIALIDYLKQYAKDMHAGFLRMSPLMTKNTVENVKSIETWRNAPVHNMDGEICWILPIEKSEEALLKEMRKSHRYLIRKAQTMPLTIIKTKEKKDMERFLPLYKDLSERKHFVPHKGIVEEFGVFTKDDQCLLLLAEYEKHIIAGALVLFVGDMAIYHHGSSLNAYKHIPASYLIQWEAIKEAKQRGKHYYNFWGIAPDGMPSHPWQGLTLFKTGFGGEKREFLHAKDLPLSWQYYKTYIIERLSKWRKGY